MKAIIVLALLVLSSCGGIGEDAKEPEPTAERDLYCFSGAAHGTLAGGEGDAMFCAKTKELCELIQLGATRVSAQGGDADLSIDTVSKCKPLKVAIWIKS